MTFKICPNCKSALEKNDGYGNASYDWICWDCYCEKLPTNYLFYDSEVLDNG